VYPAKRKKAIMVRDWTKSIGETIRKYRLAAHMSQMALAEKIGISYQQLQKYEKGINNISVYRLQQICESLNIPLSVFFGGREAEKIAEDVSQYGMHREEKTLLDLFRRIENRDIRRGLLLEMKGIVKELKKK
jgi:transcriptional regulator with XRE-family HTH domain